MRNNRKHSGSTLLVVVFIIAVMATLISGMLQITTEQFKLMSNQLHAAKSYEIAEAGLNDAFAQIRSDASWKAGFGNKAFSEGSYTVDVNSLDAPKLVIQSVGKDAQGYTTRLLASVSVSSQSPAIIRIDDFKVNK